MSVSTAKARGAASIDARRIDAWEALIRAAPDRDDFGRNVGEIVGQNLRVEKGLKAIDRLELMRGVLVDGADYVDFAGPAHAIERFISKCRTFQRRGPGGASSGQVLWRVLPEEALRAVLNESLGLDRHDPGPTWNRFRAACIEGKSEAWNFLRNPLALHPLRHQVFATLRPQTGTPLEPDAWDATTACRRLGLSRHWGSYGQGARLWMLRYDDAAGVLDLFAPTVADAEWRSLFRPSGKRRGVRFGYTVPLDDPDGVGEPEIVHAHTAAQAKPPSSAPTGAPIVLTALPRFLGEVNHGA